MPQSSLPSFLLSPAQRRLWFLNVLEGTGTIFCSHRCFRLTGQLDLEVLRAAVLLLVERHEMLRTVFAKDSNSPDGVAQHVLKQMEVPVGVVSLAGIPDGDREGIRLVREAIWLPFNLSMGPLIRIFVVALSNRAYLILFSFHQIIADGWAEDILFRDLSAIYSGLVSGCPPTLPKLTLNYVDWAQRQRNHLEKDERERLLNWWRKKLSGASRDIPLPSRQPALRTPTSGSRLQRSISPAVMEALHELVRRERTTLYTALATIYGMSLERLSGRDDFLIGTPESNREEPAIANVVGFFLNILVLRIDLKGCWTFRQKLRRMRTTIIEAYEHKALPIEELVADLNPERSADQTPVIQVCFTFRSADHGGKRSLVGASAEELDVGCEASRFALTVGVDEQREGASLWALFNPNILYADTVDAFTKIFVDLLQEAAYRPDAVIPCSALPATILPKESPAGEPEAASGGLFPDAERGQRMTDAALNPLIRTLSLEMAQTLNLPSVRIDDNFFELGGHSFLALRFLASIETQLGLRVSLRSWLRQPTVATLVRLILPSEEGDDFQPLSNRGNRHNL
jgi:hypothetical protein